MQTRKLYYEDSHLKTFASTVTGCKDVNGGYAVTLDVTAFYPEGGGQACDTGTLGDAHVVDVREAGEEILHLCDHPLAVGSKVTGNIDWEQRFHRMQQHSGEHMVSGVVHRRYGWHNVGFHMGSEVVTIDFDGPIPGEDLQKIENTVNRAIWQNLPVKCYYPTEDELPTVPYRRKKDLPWPVRIVEFPGIDLCACCGTQVKHTGEIGLVKLFSCVKFHQGVRIEMACGKRALALLSDAYQQNKLVSQAFSAKIGETGAAAERMNEALNAEKFRAAGLEKRLFAYIAQSYVNQRLAVHFEENLSPVANRELCDAIAGYATMAVTLSGTDEAGYSFCLVTRDGDLREQTKRLTAALGGRGGGKPNFQQGSVKATKAQIEAFFA